MIACCTNIQCSNKKNTNKGNVHQLPNSCSKHKAYTYSTVETKIKTKSLWGNIAHCCKHGNPSVLELCLTTSLEVLNAAVRSKSCRIPESHRLLHTQLVLEGTQCHLSQDPDQDWYATRKVVHVGNRYFLHSTDAASRHGMARICVNHCLLQKTIFTYISAVDLPNSLCQPKNAEELLWQSLKCVWGERLGGNPSSDLDEQPRKDRKKQGIRIVLGDTLHT